MLGKSASKEMEKLMISKLYKECGQIFTSKLESMFKDIDNSNEMMSHYHAV